LELTSRHPLCIVIIIVIIVINIVSIIISSSITTSLVNRSITAIIKSFNQSQPVFPLSPPLRHRHPNDARLHAA